MKHYNKCLGYEFSVPKGWRLLKRGTIERAGDKMNYGGPEWFTSHHCRWGTPVSDVVPTIRRIAKKRGAKK